MTRAAWTNTEMTVLIDGEQKHTDGDGATNRHYMVVDGHGFLVDLSQIVGSLVDPTIRSVTWGLQIDGNTMRRGGTITRHDGSKQLFWDNKLLKPYLDAWRLKRDELLQPASTPEQAQ